MTVHVAVDFGTSSTCVAVSVDGREPQVVVVDGQPLVPSAVFVASDGTVFVGQEADRQAAVDPARYEPHPKRRIDEGELLLGSTVISVLDVIRAVLTRAVNEARRLVDGAPVDLLVLTHPADWGAIRTRVLRQAGHGLSRELALVPEPVAAAVFHAASHALPDGVALAVLDLGGGTVDVSVVRRQATYSGHDAGHGVAGFQVLATRGEPNFGGADIDQLLLDHVGSLVSTEDPDAWRGLVEGREMADRRRRRALRQDVRGAKETLSRHAYTDVPLPPPFPDAHVTRADLERLISAPLTRAAELTVATIAEAGLRPAQLVAVFLVGGSSRIPLVARLTHERTGVIPTTLDQPETVVARGALRAITLDPMRTGGLPGSPHPHPHRPPHPGALKGPFSAPDALKGPTSALDAPKGPFSASSTPPLNAPAAGARRPPGPPVPPVPVNYPAAAGPPKRKKVWWLVGGTVVVVAALAAGAVLMFGRHDDAPAGKQLAVFDYGFRMPDTWTQTGGDQSKRTVQVKPSDAQQSADSITVQEFRLDYDSTTDRDRAITQLRTLVQQAGYDDFESNATYAGRQVAHYVERTSGSTVDWYVLFQDKVQVSIGCGYTADGQDEVRGACDQVVATMQATG